LIYQKLCKLFRQQVSISYRFKSLHSAKNQQFHLQNWWKSTDCDMDAS